MRYKQFFSGLFIVAASFNLNAHSLSDEQGTIYEGLQDLEALRVAMDLEPDQTLGTIGENNLVRSLLSAWDETSIQKAIASYGDIKKTAKIVVESAFSGPLFDASGFAVSKDVFVDMVNNSSFLEGYYPEARGITLDDTDALFVPSDTFLTKNLAGTANTASNQKSSSTLIPANTPVYIFGQIQDLPDEVSKDQDSWFLIWREEFGLKFVRSRHIGRLNQDDTHRFIRLVNDKPNPEIIRTGRVQRHFYLHNYAMLMPGTMPLHDDEHYLLANRNNANGETIQVGNTVTLAVYGAALTEADLTPKDSTDLSGHLKQAPIKETVENYLAELHNTLFYYPHNKGRNYHRSFAWGEGLTGIDNQHGQDISNFVYKLMLGFGLRLSRYSADQIDKGLTINKIEIDRSTDKESHYKTLVESCTLGRMASFAKTGHMVCVGSISMTQLEQLDQKAYTDALSFGMSGNDRIPLVASSPVGFKDPDTGNWTITPKAAIFPIFKTGPYSSWINREEELKIFSFFTDSPKLETKIEL